jgi:hypothetical protein
MVVLGAALTAVLLLANLADDSDWIYLLLALAGLIVFAPIFMPTTTERERTLWLWLSLPFLITAFFLKDPNTHFYIFYTPWMLVCGQVLAWLWQQARHYLKPQPAYLLGGGLIAVALSIFGGYAYAFFVAAPQEVVRHWQEQTLLPNWLTWTDPQDHALFGFPHVSGWHMVNQLYADGRLQGDYVTNVRHWVPEWYIRHAAYCEDNPDVVLIERLERLEKQAGLYEFMGDRYKLWGVIDAFGEPRLEIYRNLPTAAAAVAHFSVSTAGKAEQISTAGFELASTELLPTTTAAGHRFGNQIELVSYRLPDTEMSRGEVLPLVLVWRALQPMMRHYTLFMQVLGPNNHKMGQLDIQPSCNEGSTDDWDVGELLPGYYRIPLFADEIAKEGAGVYPLVIGLYDSQSQERLPLSAASGEAMGDALVLAQITVKP